MATVKAVIHKHKQKKDKTYPIAIRIIKDRKTSHISLGQYILLKDWNENLGQAKKSHPNSVRLNNHILKKLQEAQASLLEVASDNEKQNYSATEIKKVIQNTKENALFFDFGIKRVLDKHNRGVFSVSKSELSILYNIEEFLNTKTTTPKEEVINAIQKRRKERNKRARSASYSLTKGLNALAKRNKITFKDIDTSFINSYKQFCAAYLGQKTRTISNQLIFIRTLYNLAIKEGVTDDKGYPFAGEKEKIRLSSGNKIGLTLKEVKRIEKLQLEPGASIWHTKNVWLYSFYMAGIRISDTLELKWADIMDGRLYYTMNKNEKPVSLIIPDKALAILQAYETRKTTSEYVFPFLDNTSQKNTQEQFRKMRNATTLFNKYLKRIAEQCNITKNLSNHIARHSFGNIAGDKINPLMLKNLYRHSDLKTTLNYQANFIHKASDDALKSVINF